MAKTNFSGPITVGPIQYTTGVSIGTNVANVGTVPAVQVYPVSQVAATSGTLITIPANSTITSMRLYVTAAWTGAASTLGIGTTTNATAFTAAGAVSAAAIGAVDITPGADATRTGNFINTGLVDVQVIVTNSNTGTGAGVLEVTYANLNASPV